MPSARPLKTELPIATLVRVTVEPAVIVIGLNVPLVPVVLSMAYSAAVTFELVSVIVPEKVGALLVGVGDTLVSVDVGPVSTGLLLWYRPLVVAVSAGSVSDALVVLFLMVPPLRTRAFVAV